MEAQRVSGFAPEVHVPPALLRTGLHSSAEAGYTARVKFTLQKGVAAGLPASPAELRAWGEAVVEGRAQTLDEQAVALVLGKPEETEPALRHLAQHEPVRALALVLRLLPLGLRFAMVNGSVVRVLDRTPKKLAATLPAPMTWVLLRRGFDAQPMARAEGLATALAMPVRDVRIRAALAFVFPEHPAFWTEADRSDDTADAPYMLLGQLREVPDIGRSTTWPPSQKVLSKLDDARLEQVSRLVRVEKLEEERHLRAAVRSAERDVRPLLADVGAHLQTLASLVPSAALLEQVVDLPPLQAPATEALRASLLEGWAREVNWDGPVRNAAWRSPWKGRGRAKVPAPRPPPGPVPEPGRWERTFTPKPVSPQLEDVWRRMEARDDVDVWGLAAILPLGPRVLPRLRALARKDPSLLAALQDIDDGALDEALLLAWDSRRRQLALAAREFARRFPLRAATAAVRLCFSDLPAERSLGLTVLRAVGEAAHTALSKLEPAQLAWVDGLRDLPPTLPARQPKLPPFVRLEALPPVVTHDGAASLGLEAMEELVGLLKRTPPDDGSALRACTSAFSAESLAALAGALFRQWVFADAPMREKWAMQALAHFPSDAWAGVLRELCEFWAAQKLSARAQEAVVVLGRMGSMTALQQLKRVLHGKRRPALQTRARLVFEEAAQRLGLTSGELEDRLFPAATVPAGHRLALGPGLSLRLFRGDLPAALTPALALARDELPFAVQRLERLMCEGQPLDAVHFTESWSMHPVLRPLTETLVWDVFRGFERVSRFIPGMDPPPLEEGLRLRPTHGIELTDAERAAFSKQLQSQPFEQLSRAVFPLQQLEGRRLQLVGRVFSVWQVLSLERLGWERSPAMEGDVSFSLTRRGEGWSASISIEPGISFSNPGYEPEQSITDFGVESTFPLTQRIASELQRDLVACLQEGAVTRRP